MSGVLIAAQIAEAYEEAGVAAGDGEGASTVVLRRPGATSGDSHNPTVGTPIDTTFVAKHDDAVYTKKTGQMLTNRQRAYSLVNHEVDTAPETSDMLVIDSQEWSIMEVLPQNPAGYILSWLVKVTR